MRFPYRAYEVSPTPASGAADGFIYRPVIPFTLASTEESLDFFGLLDTGADETYITYRMAERLKLSTDGQSRWFIESASGEISVAYCTATIEVTDGVERYLWRFEDRHYGPRLVGSHPRP